MISEKKKDLQNLQVLFQWIMGSVLLITYQGK